MSSLYGAGAKLVGQALLIGTVGGMAGTGAQIWIRKLQVAHPNRRLKAQNYPLGPYHLQLQLVPDLKNDIFSRTHL